MGFDFTPASGGSPYQAAGAGAAFMGGLPAAAIIGGLPLLANGLNNVFGGRGFFDNNDQAYSGSGISLPFMGSRASGVGDLDKLISELTNASAPPRLLAGATNAARQEANSRGLEGGIAASLATQAQGDANFNWDSQRRDLLSRLLGQRNDIIGGIQNEESNRRTQDYTVRQARAQAQQNQLNQLLALASRLLASGLE